MILNRPRENLDSSLFHALNPAIVVMDNQGNMVLFSVGAETLFGIRNAQIQRLGFGQCIPCPKEYQGNITAYLHDYAENTPNMWMEPLIAYRYDGVRFPVVYRIARMPDANHLSVCEFIDTSNHQKMRYDLEHRLQETLSASKAKSRFLHHMTQQFRVPLNRLLGTISDSLDMGVGVSQQYDQLEQALQSGKELQRNLSEMVDFIQLETDQLEFQNISFNLRLVLEEIVDSFSDLAKRKNIELATLVSPYVPESVIGDPDRLHQILQSLLSNAFRFTHEGGITVKVECQIENASHAVIELEVADTGEGMSEEKAQSIRSAFERRDTTFADRYGGLGIGLAISKELLGLMGGTLTLRSMEGIGSTFKMTIKMPKGIDLVASQQLPRQQRLLLVTDSPQDRTKLMEYCGEWQLNVECQGSGNLALERLRQAQLRDEQFHVVLIDLNHPRLAGIQLVQEIKKIPAFENQRIILLTEDREQALHPNNEWLRMDAVLLKPVRKQTLHDAIATVASRDAKNSGVVLTDRSLQQAHLSRAPRALLVEDNEVNQIIAKGALKKLGVHADVTNNGEEAIEAVLGKRYDFVLMDCDMPIMDGFEATRTIRAWEKDNGGHLPIIALTASDAASCHEECMEAGMDEYMQKPFRADQLESVLLRVRSKLN